MYDILELWNTLVPTSQHDETGFWRGIQLFNERAFFDAHEVLEDVWREAPAQERAFLQGVIQIAVALHHYSTGNLAGASSVLARGEKNLTGYGDAHSGIDVAALRQDVRKWRDALARGTQPPAWPLVQRADATIGSLVNRGASPEARSTTPRRAKPPHGGNPGQRVPMLDLRRQYGRIREEVLAAIERVCASQNLILGEEVAGFEQAAAAFLGAQVVVGCASGTDALWLALAAAGVGPGDSVITTPFSFLASATAIVRVGARPVFVDIDPATFNLSAELVERRIREVVPASLRAIMPVHLFGQCAEMDAFSAIAAEHKVGIVEDAAQAFGAAWRGKRAGTLGTAGAFSFYPTKNLSAFGDGGCVATNDASLAEHVRILGNHGSRERYYHDEIGWNSRLDAIQAAILGVKLKHVARWNEERRERAAEYDRLFADAGLGGAESPIQLPYVAGEAYHIFHQYVIRAARRDELQATLAERGVATAIYYPLPIHLQKCFTYLGYRQSDFPEAERAANGVLALPMFPELTPEEQRCVVEAIAEFYA